MLHTLCQQNGITISDVGSILRCVTTDAIFHVRGFILINSLQVKLLPTEPFSCLSYLFGSPTGFNNFVYQVKTLFEYRISAPHFAANNGWNAYIVSCSWLLHLALMLLRVASCQFQLSSPFLMNICHAILIFPFSHPKPAFLHLHQKLFQFC